MLWLVTAAHAQSASTGVQGFAEVRGQAYLGVDGVPWLLVERVRPEFTAKLSPAFSLVATPNAELTEGRDLQSELERTVDASDFGVAFTSGSCTWPEVTNDLFHLDTTSDWLTVDRLYLDAYSNAADVRVGRQPVQWGSALIVNPTDPFPEVLFEEPWRFRSGVNAARASFPLGPHELQAFVGTDDAFTVPRLAGRATLNALQTDFSLIGAYRGETKEGLVGADIKGTLGVGFWTEDALHLPSGGADPYEELTVGVDYSFSVMQLLYVAAQYYRNGSGSPDASQLTSGRGLGTSIESPTCAPGALPEDSPLATLSQNDNPYAPAFVGRDYAMAVVRANVTEELQITAAGVQNLGDGTGIAIPQVTVQPNGWFEVSAVAQLPYRAWGDGGEFSPAPADLRILYEGQSLDLGGLVPSATFSLWTRASF